MAEGALIFEPPTRNDREALTPRDDPAQSSSIRQFRAPQGQSETCVFSRRSLAPLILRRSGQQAEISGIFARFSQRARIC